MKRLLAVVAVLVLMVGIAHAHNGMIHVMGTVTNVTDTTITVHATDGKTQTVAFTSNTKYARMDTAIPLKDVKVGDQVVIHATKKDNQLIAVTVKIGMAGMKMGGKASAH